MKKLIMMIVTLCAAVWYAHAADAAIVVGRISHVEGDIYRYMDVDDSWVATQLQSPVGIEDVLATGPESRAEITFPNDLLMRMDGNTEIDILELDDGLGVFVLRSGLARIYNRSGSGKLVIETVQGTATVSPGSVIDMRAEGSSVVVSAVAGQAAFKSIHNGAESLEVISGTTSLEFTDGSIVAGTGPISRNWDKWCAAREGAWARNRLVRSEYLPESMQEYAYEIEPYGSWSRVYYRGYYYWAWKPRHVAVGWSPYTTGYWYDWHGSPVWMDHNPWGWATHHHGHWITLNGSWMWTPYVHVSHVPGVTVVGLNIRFGRTYRPHWHPGRVRWISHNDYIGWFPLAPWENYYGYRRWEAGTVLVQGGSVFSLSVNLSQHRHIDHAVIIPNRYLHKRGPVVVNNYNTVKIRNINKRVIIKDYRPLLTAERERARPHRAAASGPGMNAAERNHWQQQERKEFSPGEIARRKRPGKRDERVIGAQKDVPEERTVQKSVKRGRGNTAVKKHTTAIERNRQYAAAGEAPKKVSRLAPRIPGKKAEKQEKPGQRKILAERIFSEKTALKKTTTEERRVPASRIGNGEKLRQRKVFAAGVTPQQISAAKTTREQKRTRESLLSRIKARNRTDVAQKKPSVPSRSAAGKKEQVQRQEKRQAQTQVARNDRDTKGSGSRAESKYSVPGNSGEKKRTQKNVRNQNNDKERNGARERNGSKQMGGGSWFSTAINGKRLQ